MLVGCPVSPFPRASRRWADAWRRSCGSVAIVGRIGWDPLLDSPGPEVVRPKGQGEWIETCLPRRGACGRKSRCGTGQSEVAKDLLQNGGVGELTNESSKSVCLWGSDVAERFLQETMRWFCDRRRCRRIRDRVSSFRPSRPFLKETDLERALRQGHEGDWVDTKGSAHESRLVR